MKAIFGLSVGDERGGLSNWIGTIASEDQDRARAMMAELYRRSSADPRVLGIGGVPGALDSVRDGGMAVTVGGGTLAAARFRELSDHPSRIDFRRFSRTNNPDLGRYDFGYDAVIKAAE